MRRLFECGLLTLCVCCGSAQAQDKADGGESDIEKAIRRGQVLLLEARLGSTPDELAQIAEAARNRAVRASKAKNKEGLFADAERYYLKVNEAIQKSTGDPTKKKHDQTLAYLKLAGMVLTHWAGGDLNTFEISGGRFGDNQRLADKLRKSRGYYEKARDLIDPLFEERDDRDNEYLALDIYDSVKAYKLDTDFNLGFANLYLGMVLDDKSPDRLDALKAAEFAFQTLVDSVGAGEAKIYHCHLGLAVAMSEQKRYDEALRHFDLAMDEGAEVLIVMQTRYEKARSLISDDKFAEARAVLKPLLDKNAKNVAGGVFHVNLALIWEAYSYLRESRVLARKAGAATVGKKALQSQAERARRTGLGKMQQLKARRKAWPKVVNLWTASSIRENQDPKTMTATELTFAASELADKKDYPNAIIYLREALTRAGVADDMQGQIHYDLGFNHYRLFSRGRGSSLKDLRLAAEAFDTVAREHRQHPDASKSVSYAYKAWAQIAKETKSVDDFAKLAGSLDVLMENFPDHKERSEVPWLLATAQQAAGQFEAAAERFEDVPAESKHWEEAQYRVALCARLACEAQRDTLSAEAFTTLARKTASTMRAYADAAVKRADGNAKVPGWAADASVGAGELLVMRGVERFQDALEALAKFETRYPNSTVMGRVLGARIKAYRGLNDFEKASALLEQYLAEVPQEKAGAVLSGLASGLQNEIAALRAAKDFDTARGMAGEAVSIFEQLLRSVSANPKQAAHKDVVKFRLARMLYFADKLDRAQALIAELLGKVPRNGRYMQLNAQIQTAKLPVDAPPETLKAAEDAWGALLRNTSLQKTAPQLYWEARFNFLDIRFRAGDAAKVAKGIKEQRVWHPELGGSPWAEKLLDLMKRAAAEAGIELDAASAKSAGDAKVAVQPEP